MHGMGSHPALAAASQPAQATPCRPPRSPHHAHLRHQLPGPALELLVVPQLRLELLHSPGRGALLGGCVLQGARKPPDLRARAPVAGQVPGQGCRVGDDGAWRVRTNTSKSKEGGGATFEAAHRLPACRPLQAPGHAVSVSVLQAAAVPGLRAAVQQVEKNNSKEAQKGLPVFGHEGGIALQVQELQGRGVGMAR